MTRVPRCATSYNGTSGMVRPTAVPPGGSHEPRTEGSLAPDEVRGVNGWGVPRHTPSSIAAHRSHSRRRQCSGSVAGAMAATQHPDPSVGRNFRYIDMSL